MARPRHKQATDLISAFTWAFNLIENNDVPAAEQLTLLHVISRANRAFWRPIPLSAAKLAASMCKDKRSVEKALAALIERGAIIQQEGGYTIGITEEDAFRVADGASRDSDVVDAGKRKTARRTARTGKDSAASELKYFGDTGA